MFYYSEINDRYIDNDLVLTTLIEYELTGKKIMSYLHLANRYLFLCS